MPCASSSSSKSSPRTSCNPAPPRSPTAWSSCTASSWTGAARMPDRLRLNFSLPLRGRAGVGALLLLLFALPCHALSVKDDLGHTLTIDRPPQRIVSLLPSLTEFTCVLGACARLVGVDDFSNHPASVRALPHVGGLEDA